jgi:hypothetical protein
MTESCSNHPNKKSLSICHSCGRPFCQDCLVLGNEFYYCKEEQCQVLLRQENSRFEKTEEAIAEFSIQRWRESSRRFYGIAGLILCIAWILLTVFLLLTVSPDKKQSPYWLPVLSFIACARWFIIVWLIRVTIYKHLFWKRKIAKDFAEGRQ